MGIVSYVCQSLAWAWRPLLRQMRRFWDTTIHIIFWLMSLRRSRVSLPPVFNRVLLLSATQLANDIRERKITSFEVVRAFITRISDVNPILNALAQESFQAALQQARKVDERIDQGYRDGTLTKEVLQKHQPFLGVPFTVKESIAAIGLPHTGGLLARKNHKASFDSDVVARMKRSGAILLGNTNISEVGMWWECDNKVYGRTTNPYDNRRSPGGSSGGEAALASACGSPLSVGTDVGGSVRTPAFFCGLFGHKPTNGIVSLRGCNMHDDIDYNDIQVAGPITRHAEDLLPMMNILAGDRVGLLSLGKSVDLGRLTIFSMANDGGGIMTSPLDKRLVDIQKVVARHFLRSFDVTVTKVYIPGMQNSFQIWREKMSIEYANTTLMSKQLADNRGEINIWTELIRLLIGRPHHTLPSLAQAGLERFLGELRFLQYQRRVLQGKELVPVPSVMEPQWKALQLRIQRLLGNNGVLLYPSHPTLAPYHNESFFRPINFTYTAIFNALGFPVTQVPLGLAPNGLPLGIQVVGGMHQDHLTISVATELEKAFGGWVCPSKIL